MATKKGGLGRGFDSLFTDNTVESTPNAELRLSQLVPNRDQPRKVFDDAALRELADSISKHGLIQPILVRPMDDGSYSIVAGERRWRASRLAGLEKVPVVIKDMTDNEAMELALIENLQREDLNPIEEAQGYKTLMDTFSMTQEQVSTRVGKSRSAVANALRLLALKDYESDALQKGEISAGHARALLSIPDSELRREAFELARSGASVREIERISKQQTPGITMKKPRIKNKLYVETEAALAEQIGRKVKISGNGKSGTLQIEFFNEEDLFDIAKKLAGDK
ncbi:MAG: ParB/RepB/Spo0J family partition protein [Clostridia bacterium]|nr:ParB/RepB/Spo0J family partition protein [Clostridia bacterium]